MTTNQNIPLIPFISVIVPIYNVELYIEKCARSLFEQTLKEIEYIFVDDCSPDNSVKILERTLEEYPERLGKVRILKLHANSGVANARRQGIAIAQGDYIALCDSDDWVDKDMYRLLYKEAIEKNSDCVLCDYYETDGIHYHPIYYKYSTKDTLISDLLSYKKGGSMCFYIAKRNLYKSIIYPQKHMWEDLVVSVQVFFSAKNIVNFYDRPLYYYYQNPQSVTYKPSLEASISRMLNSGENINLIETFLADSSMLTRFNYEIVLLKYYSLFFISEYTANKQIRRMWKNKYPGLVKKILHDKKYPRDIRFKTFLLNIGLFPLFKRISTFIRSELC